MGTAARDAVIEHRGIYALHHEGTAPPIVLIHGGLDRSSSFGRVNRALATHEVLRYDRRGYGRSRSADVTDLAGHVADLIDLLETVLGGRSAALVGHSIGGVIALVAARRRPELVGSVLAYEPPTPWAPWWPRDPDRLEDPADEAERFMRQMVSDAIWDRLPARTRADRRSEGGALAMEVASLGAGPVPWGLGALDCRVTVAAGGDTSWWHARAAEEVAADLGAPLVVVEGASHGVHLTHPVAFANLVRVSLEG